MSARFIVADVFDGLAAIEDGTVDLVVTSPPFIRLRSYLPADHPDKDKEIGHEATPAEFLDTLLAVTAELRRVLAPHGSICVELGDTYAGSGGAGGDYLPGGLREGQPKFDGSAVRGRAQVRDYDGGASDRWDFAKPGTRSRLASGDGWPLPKSKALIPELYRVALAYGINPLTGAESPAGRWRIRNVVTWCKPNPPVGALGDKWRPATSDVVVACTSDKRYWDDIATRRESSYSRERNATRVTPNGQRPRMVDDATNPAGAPLLDWHSPLADAIDRAAAEGFALGRHTTEPLFGEAKNEVKETIGQRMLRELVEQGAIDSGDVLYLPPGGYPGSHYAVYPPALIEPLIKAMAPPKVCRQCGEPSRRIVEKTPEYAAFRASKTGVELTDARKAYHLPEKGGAGSLDHRNDDGARGELYQTAGWTDCGHNNWRPAVILDPFVGSGTTLAVATGHGHDAIGIDLDERNYQLALERVGPMLLGPPERVEGHLR